MKRKRILLLAAALTSGTVASAQFFQSGSDPFGAWSTIGTPHYRILYPRGLDSLARTYILDLEKLTNAKENLTILHPLPRVNEISVEVDNDPRACYFFQALCGKHIRMALILFLLGIKR